MSFGSQSLKLPSPDTLKIWTAIREYGCLCCRIRAGEYRYPEMHHILRNGLRVGHSATKAKAA